MKNLHKKVPDVARKKFQTYSYLIEQDKNAYAPLYSRVSITFDISLSFLENKEIVEVLFATLNLTLFPENFRYPYPSCVA